MLTKTTGEPRTGIVHSTYSGSERNVEEIYLKGHENNFITKAENPMIVPENINFTEGNLKDYVPTRRGSNNTFIKHNNCTKYVGRYIKNGKDLNSRWRNLKFIYWKSRI